MFWLGAIHTIFATLAFLFKACVIWSVSRNPNHGGGVPTLDFILFHPIFLAVGITVLLKSLDYNPIPFFGLAIYASLLALSIFVHWLFERLGREHRELPSQPPK